MPLQKNSGLHSISPSAVIEKFLNGGDYEKLASCLGHDLIHDFTGRVLVESAGSDDTTANSTSPTPRSNNAGSPAVYPGSTYGTTATSYPTTPVDTHTTDQSDSNGEYNANSADRNYYSTDTEHHAATAGDSSTANASTDTKYYSNG
jgi:hypothetical protein